MSGIICFACSISAISVLQCALKKWRNDLNTIQEKNESQQNRDQWWILLQGRRKPGEEKLWKSRSLEYNCWERGKTGEIWYRHRPNESFRSLLSWAIHGKLLLNKLLKMGWWPCLVFSRVEYWYWDVRAIGATRWNFLESDTRNSTWFLSRGNPSWWNRAIRYEWGNASWQTGATRYRFSRRRGMASTIRHWKRWSRIGIVSRIKIIHESGEWSRAKKTEKNFKCYRKCRKTFYDLVNVHNCNNGISSPLWTQQISHFKKWSTYLQDWCLSKMRSQGWITHRNTCH